MPIRNTASMISSGVWTNSWYTDETGRPELADQIAHAYVLERGDDELRADRSLGALVAIEQRPAARGKGHGNQEAGTLTVQLRESLAQTG